jgi:hypothetical protein
LAAVVGLLVAAAPASADSTATATPATPGKATTLNYELDLDTAPFSGRIPLGFSLVAPPGIKLNTKAVPKTCNTRRVAWGDCSPQSLIGTGTMSVTTVANPIGQPSATYHDTLPINLFRGEFNQIVAFALIDNDARLAPGTLNTANGLSFSLVLPLIHAYKLVFISVDHISLTLGGRRTFTVKVKKRHGKHVRIRRKLVHRDVLTLPKTCGPNGTWDSGIVLTYPDNSMASASTPVACAPAK